MRAIGLIGGMSFESTLVYYRLINELVRERIGGLGSADIHLRSVNFAQVVEMQKAGRWDLAADALAQAAKGLQSNGSQCVLICTNTMHLVAPQVQDAVGIPLIHIIDETAKALLSQGHRRPLLLATRYTMEHGFYAERMRTLGLDVIVPDEDQRADMHAIIFEELCAGKVLDCSRERAVAMIRTAAAKGADSVILGCTEICLLLDPHNLPLPAVDSTAVHATAAVEFALEGHAGMPAAA
jgi:aspartate racemase